MGDTPDTCTAPVLKASSAEVLRHRWLGAGGAVALSVASGWAGAPQVFHPVSHWYEPQPTVTLAAAALGYAGLVVLAGSWWRLGQLTPSGAAGGGREMLITLCWWATPLAVGAPLFSRDVYSYVAQGAMGARGMDVYTAGPSLLGGPLAAGVPSLWQNTPAPYGPVFMWLADHVVRVTGEHVPAAVAGMRVVAVLGLALIVWAVRRLAVATGVCEARALWLAVLNPLVLTHLVGGAHNDAVMVGLMLCGLVLARRGKPAWGAVVITLAMLVKAPAGLGLLFLIPGSSWTPGSTWTPGSSWTPGGPGGRGGLVRRTVVVAATSAATVVAATAVLGYGYGWLSALGTPVSGAGLLSLTSDAGTLLAALMEPLGLAGSDTVVTVARLSGVAAALAAIPFWLRQVPRLGPERAFGMALLTVVVLAPAVQPWYFLWGAIPVAATAADRRIRTRLAAASIALLFVAFLHGQVATVSYALCCYTGVAVALVALYRFDPVAGSCWRVELTHRQSAQRRSPAIPASRTGEDIGGLTPPRALEDVAAAGGERTY